MNLNNAVVKARIGFANNSSSSHSIVFGIRPQDDKDLDGYYGWGNFVLSSKKSKLHYMKAQLVNNILNSIDINGLHYLSGDYHDMSIKMEEDIITRFIESNKLNIRCHKSYREEYDIDHQSVIDLPFDENKEINIEFWKELTDYIVNSDMSILGGNDNSEEGLEKNDYIFLPLSTDNRRENIYDYAVKDKDTNTWIIKNTSNGSLFVLNFNKKLDQPSGIKSGVPLLVDLNITSKCENNCNFC